MNPTLLTHSPAHPLTGSPSVHVEWRGYPLRFHFELCRSVFTIVSREQATCFATHREALEAATGANLREHVATIERTTP